jgi:hypothetical protein
MKWLTMVASTLVDGCARIDPLGGELVSCGLMIIGDSVDLAFSKQHAAGLFLHHTVLYYGILLVPRGRSGVRAMGAQAPLPARALWS